MPNMSLVKTPMPEQDPNVRNHNFKEVSLGYTEEMAKEEAARMLARANAQIELERKKAADDMKKEMIQVASLMAQKVVAGSMDREIQDSLVEETLKEIGDQTWQN